MKHLMLTTALIAAGAAGAVQAEAHKDATAASPFMAQPGEQSIHASNFIGMRVYAAENSGEMTEAEGAGHAAAGGVDELCSEARQLQCAHGRARAHDGLLVAVAVHLDRRHQVLAKDVLERVGLLLS